MSKRARITLNPEAGGAEKPEADTTPSAANGLALNTGTIIKAAAIGLAVVSMFFLFRGRRP